MTAEEGSRIPPLLLPRNKLNKQSRDFPHSILRQKSGMLRRQVLSNSEETATVVGLPRIVWCQKQLQKALRLQALGIDVLHRQASTEKHQNYSPCSKINMYYLTSNQPRSKATSYVREQKLKQSRPKGRA